MALEVLKTYLVKIKHEVDREAQTKAIAEIDTTKSKLSNLFSFTSSGTIKAGAIITSTITSINALLTSTINQVSKADVAAERFARQMWTSEKNARAMLTALDAVGSSDYSDIYNMTPEEFNRLMQLRNLSLSLEAPKETQETLVLIRDIGHELNKLQVIFEYAKQWFVYAFGKYAGKDLNDIKNSFKEMNEYLMKYLPVVTDYAAKFFYIIFRLGSTGAYLIKTLASALFNLLNNLPTKAKAAGAGITAFLGMLKLGPLGIFIAALTTLLLLLDDYMVWKKGGKSLLGDTWQSLDDALGSEDSALNKALDIFEGIFDVGGDILSLIYDLTTATIEWADEMGILSGIVNGMLSLLNTAGDIVGGITGYISYMNKGNKLMDMYREGLITKEEYKQAKRELRNEYYGGVSDYWSGVFGNGSGFKSFDETAAKSYTSKYGSTSNNYTMNQTNNVNVTQSSGESAESTGYKVAKQIATKRNYFKVLK